MIFHRSRIKTTSKEIVMQNQIIENTRCTKFLGVIIDDKLKWTNHITYIQNKIAKSIGILYRTRFFLDTNTLTNLYHTFIFPYLIYCVELWGNAASIHLNPIVLLQKKCLRTITFSVYLAPSMPLFQQTNILAFEKLVIQRIALMMFKYSKQDLPRPIQNLFSVNNEVHTHLTRSSTALRTPRGEREERYRTFSFRGVYIWNHISQNVNIDVSYASFKHIVKKYIQTNELLHLRLNM